jgi:hypothetical protein
MPLMQGRFWDMNRNPITALLHLRYLRNPRLKLRMQEGGTVVASALHRSRSFLGKISPRAFIRVHPC